MIVRPARMADLDSLEICAKAANGIINLPKEKTGLEERITKSIDSLNKQITAPEDEDYLFVLTDDKTIAGTAGIYSQLTHNHPLYVFHVGEMRTHNLSWAKPAEKRMLTAQRYPEDVSELCALYLLPNLRKEGFGKLLSFSRLLFIAAHPQRFSNTIVANMRGFIEEGESPFWNEVGKKFLPLNFSEIQALRSKSEAFIAQFLPKYPIYVSFLSDKAKMVIGETYPSTQPAVKMLLQEEFVVTEDIDPIDAGPILKGKKSEIKSIVNSHVATIHEIIPKAINSPRYILGNERLDFRACYGTLNFLAQDKVIISEETANALDLNEGELLRYIEG